MAHRLRGKILAFIRSQRVARQASVGANRTPHNVPITEGESVIICVTPTTSFSWGL